MQVPFVLASKFSAKFMKNWKDATSEFLKHTGIEWVPKSSHDCFYVAVKDNKKGECTSHVGKVAAGQELNLGVTLCFLVYHQFFELISWRFRC